MAFGFRIRFNLVDDDRIDIDEEKVAFVASSPLTSITHLPTFSIATSTAEAFAPAWQRERLAPCRHAERPRGTGGGSPGRCSSKLL
jgi:hypothetical protein